MNKYTVIQMNSGSYRIQVESDGGDKFLLGGQHSKAYCFQIKERAESIAKEWNEREARYEEALKSVREGA